MHQYSVLIIGAGRIGAFLDSPESSSVQTHGHAFSAHPGFSLTGFVDAAIDTAARAAAVWGGSAFISVDDAFSRGSIDAVVVAVPDDAHYDLLKELAGYPLRLVFAEKPLTRTVSEAEEILEMYRERSLSLAVNFSRRFVPEVTEMRKRIASDEFGRFLGGSGWYGKGTLHNGSHLVDLLRFLAGEVEHASAISSVQDWSGEDPSCSAVLKLKNGSEFFMHAVDCRCFTIFEMDLVFERGRVRIVDSGLRIEVRMAGDDAMYPGFRSLQRAEICVTGHVNALAFAAEHLYAHLKNGAALCSTGADGLAAQTVCNKILAGRR